VPFKDHLVTWVGEYLVLEHGEARANEILDDIDRWFVPFPLFPNPTADNDGQHILELQQLLSFQTFVDSHMAVASNNGQVTTQRH
jgi:hypothetical protein